MPGSRRSWSIPAERPGSGWRAARRYRAGRSSPPASILYESRLIFAEDRVVLDLKGADLVETNLSGAILIEARLRGTNLSEADLSDAYPIEAKLSRAILHGAYLEDADLRGADLRDVQGVTDEELDQQAKSLEGATMPNGQKYEDWLKTREGEG